MFNYFENRCREKMFRFALCVYRHLNTFLFFVGISKLFVFVGLLLTDGRTAPTHKQNVLSGNWKWKQRLDSVVCCNDSNNDESFS